MKFSQVVLTIVYLLLCSAAHIDVAGAAPDSKYDHSRLIEDAAAGDVEAQYTLAHLYLKGRGGMARDVERAIGWLERAAASDHPDAALDLALIYLEDTAVRGNSARALAWLTRAADLGQPDAQYFLGLAYRASDPTEAVRWLKEAEAAGHTEAGDELKRICRENKKLCF
ncbi:MAG: tetratricopeptide repeat protein [Desulfocapsaceae bacterium]